MPDPTITLRDVGRSFGPVTALHNASLEAPAGAITVLLGANGAGKTTAIRLITGALQADTGLVRVFGQDPSSAAGEDIRRRCGVVSAKPSLYDRLNGWDNLRYAAELFGLGRGAAVDHRIRAAAETFDIGDSLDLMVGGYSTGMKTRLALSRAVLHDPDLLLLDEPTSGLDPESAATVLDLIRAMTHDGRTVLMCTHLLLEAEGLADRVVIMEDGSTIVSGVPDDLAQRYWPQPLVRIGSDPDADVTLLDQLSTMNGVEAYQREAAIATVTLDGLDRTADLIAELCARGARIHSVEPYRPSLEDLYFAVQASRRVTGHDEQAQRPGPTDDDAEPIATGRPPTTATPTTATPTPARPTTATPKETPSVAEPVGLSGSGARP